MHLPHGATRAEPTGITLGPGKLEAAEKLASDISVKVRSDLVLKQLMRQ
jgi:hypothetical protein